MEQITAWVWAAAAAVIGLILFVRIAWLLLRKRKTRPSTETNEHPAGAPEKKTPDYHAAQEYSPRPMQSKEVNEFVSLRSLEFSNLRSFSELHLSFKPPPISDPAVSGQWIVLLGDNGVGKSTILRGLALGLVEPSVATALLQTQLTLAPFVRLGHKHSFIKIKLEGWSPYHVELFPGQPSESLSAVEASESRPAIFAYGSQRGSALGGPTRQVSFSPLNSVATLFNESAELIHAETWLQKLRLGALESTGGPDEVFYEAVRNCLLKLLPGVEDIEVSSKTGVRMTGSAVGEKVPMASLSDGYLSTTGWALDMIARWSERFRRIEGKQPDGEMALEIKGLVLIDEIGLHLHPLWQIDVIRAVRDMFPKMSFVATSHHPLTLIGARAGEVHVLRRIPETNAIEIVQEDVPKGCTADDILTGYWFNLPSTLDPETQELLEKHRQMLRDGVDEDDRERRKLEATLRKRLGSFATTSIDKMAQSVLAEVISEEPEEPVTEEQRREIKERMAKKLKESDTL